MESVKQISEVYRWLRHSQSIIQKPFQK